MTEGRLQQHTEVLEAATATGLGKMINVADFRHVQVVVAADGGASGTVKFPASFVEEWEDVDMSAAALPGNEWDFVAAYNLNDPSSILTGDTGLVVAADGVEQLIINTDGINFLSANITDYTSGNFTVTIIGYTNA